MKNAITPSQQAGSSEWAPLRIAAFRAIWFASLAANIGTWFQNVGGVWLMTHFTSSPVLIALMQTATTLPVFLVDPLAGALADIVNRRRLLLATEGLILVAAAALAVLTYAGLMNAPLLLAFTFVLGLGAILGNPAWQAMQHCVRSREHAFGLQHSSRRTKQGEQFGGPFSHIFVGQAPGMICRMPVDSGMGNRLIGPSLILAPDLDTSSFTNEIGQFNQSLFLFGLWIVNGDHSCFALA